MKTIFFTLFATNVYNNFLIFPQSVIKRLNEEKKLRVILLVNENFVGSLKKYNLGENIVVEVIKKMPPRTRLQNLFYFFYSYLIFTGTTRLLATFGARADTPPAGGNRHLAFLKSAMAGTLGRSKFIKVRAVPWLYKKIFSERPYKYLFTKHKPDLVFISDLAFFPDVEILAEARRQKIKTIGMPSNWDHLNKYYIPLHVDHLLIQNEPMKKEAIAWHEYEEKQITITGFPQFDFYVHGRQFIKPRGEFLAEQGFPAASKIILFISASVYFLDETDILKKIYGWAEAGELGEEVNLIMRPYPVRTLKESYADLENKPKIKFFWEQLWDNLEANIEFLNMMYHADVVISVFSTTAMEVATFNKPAITLGFDGHSQRPWHKSVKRLEKLSHFKNVLDTGGVKVVDSFDELFSTINKYLKHPKESRNKCEILKDKMCYRVDGRASERVVNFILDKINES